VSKHLKIQDLLERTISNKDRFPFLSKLLEIVAILPASTSSCERGFSQMNLIKGHQCIPPLWMIYWWYILLHVWGFLGNIMWALSHNNAVVHCYVSLAMQQFKRRPICSIVTHMTIDTEMFLWSWHCCLRTSIDLVNRVWKSLSADVLVCLATDSGWFEDWVCIGKLREKHVSSYRGRWRQSIIEASAG
jgi:hypothetical protein